VNAPPLASLLSQRTLLGELLESVLPPITYLDTPTLGEASVFYERALALLAGHPKQGKTMVAATVIADRVAASLPTLYLDFENGKYRIARRLKAMGLEPAALDEHLIYVTGPQVALDTLYAELQAVLSEYPDLLIVADSWRGLVTGLSGAVHNFDHNSSLHIERVFAPLRDIVTVDGATVIVLDHPAKTTTSKSGYAASNSAAKEQVADIIYWVEQVEPYSVHQVGALSIQVKHDRDGMLSREVRRYRIGGQGEDGRLQLTPADAHEVGKGRTLAQAVEAWLADNAQGEDAATSLKEVKAAVTGDNGAIGKEVKRLADDASSPVRATTHKTPRYYCDGPARPPADDGTDEVVPAEVRRAAYEVRATEHRERDEAARLAAGIDPEAWKLHREREALEADDERRAAQAAEAAAKRAAKLAPHALAAIEYVREHSPCSPADYLTNTTVDGRDEAKRRGWIVDEGSTIKLGANAPEPTNQGVK
jgi:hypothetical protein